MVRMSRGLALCSEAWSTFLTVAKGHCGQLKTRQWRDWNTKLWYASISTMFDTSFASVSAVNRHTAGSELEPAPQHGDPGRHGHLQIPGEAGGPVLGLDYANNADCVQVQDCEGQKVRGK